jgi:DNA-binding protein H-NS
MSIDKLTALRDQVDAIISSKVTEERRALEAEHGKLSRFAGGGNLRGRRGALRGVAVAPKYRNPENSSETWAGRGLKPRWLVAALKSGKKIEDFAIGGGSAGAVKKTARKMRKGAKK